MFRKYYYKIFWKQLNLNVKGTESGLFPVFYNDTSACESGIGMNTKRCCKNEYCRKTLTRFSQFRMREDLLIFQYYRWIFSTMTGAIHSSGPMRLLISQLSIQQQWWRTGYQDMVIHE